MDAKLSLSGSCAEDCTGLGLFNRGIVHVANGTFARMLQLNSVTLSQNAITLLHPDTFKHNTALIYLLLNNDTIAGLHPNTFKHNTALEQLFLNCNAITELHPDTFSTLTTMT